MNTNVEKYVKLSTEIYNLCSRKQMLQRHCIGLGKMECELLNYLYSLEYPVSMNTFANKLNVSHSRITRIVDNLVEKKLVHRFPSEKDRRSWLAEITDKGKKANEQTHLDFQSIHESLIKKLPKDKTVEIYEWINIYLEKFNEVLDEREE